MIKFVCYNDGVKQNNNNINNNNVKNTMKRRSQIKQQRSWKITIIMSYYKQYNNDAPQHNHSGRQQASTRA